MTFVRQTYLVKSNICSMMELLQKHLVPLHDRFFRMNPDEATSHDFCVATRAQHLCPSHSSLRGSSGREAALTFRIGFVTLTGKTTCWGWIPPDFLLRITRFTGREDLLLSRLQVIRSRPEGRKIKKPFFRSGKLGSVHRSRGQSINKKRADPIGVCPFNLNFVQTNTQAWAEPPEPCPSQARR